MKAGILFFVIFVVSSVSLFAADIEVKGNVTFKTITTNGSKSDTVVTKGTKTLVTLFNAKTSKNITYTDSSGYYYFILDDAKQAKFTNIQFMGPNGEYVTYPIKNIKQPFFDVEFVNYVTETKKGK